MTLKQYLQLQRIYYQFQSVTVGVTALDCWTMLYLFKFIFLSKARYCCEFKPTQYFPLFQQHILKFIVIQQLKLVQGIELLIKVKNITQTGRNAPKNLRAEKQPLNGKDCILQGKSPFFTILPVGNNASFNLSHDCCCQTLNFFLSAFFLRCKLLGLIPPSPHCFPHSDLVASTWIW